MFRHSTQHNIKSKKKNNNKWMDSLSSYWKTKQTKKHDINELYGVRKLIGKKSIHGKH